MPRNGPRINLPCRFRGWNCFVPPGQLTAEWLAEADNIELIDGVVRPRRGYLKLEAGDLTGVDPVGTVGGLAKIPAASGPPTNASFLVLTISESVDSQARAWFLYANGALTKISYGPQTPAPAAWSWASLMSNTNRPSHVVAGGWTLLAQAATVVKAFAPTGSFTLPTNYANPFRRAGLEAPIASPLGAAPSGAGGLTIDAIYTYVITHFDTNSKLESDASPVSPETAITSSGNQKIRVSWLCENNYYKLGNTSALPTDLFANKVRLYRRMVYPTVESDHSFVAQLDIDLNYSGGISYYDDAIGDDERIVDVTPPARHGVPPGSAFMVRHQDRAVYLPHNTNRFYVSEPTQVDTTTGEARSGAEYVYQLTQFELPSSGRITGGASHGSMLLLFQREKVYVVDLTPLPESPYVYEIEGVPGTVSHWTIATTPATDNSSARTLWLATTGVYEFNGSAGRLVSKEVQQEMREARLLESGSPWDYSAPLGTYDIANRRYILFYGKNTVNTRPSLALVYSLDSDGWVRWTLPTGDAVGDVIVLDEGYSSQPIMFTGVLGSTVGFGLLRWHRDFVEPYYTDDGVAISWSFKTPNMNLGDTAARKHVHDIYLSFEPFLSGTPTADMAIYLNGESSPVVTKPGLIMTSRLAAHLGAPCRSVAVKVSGTMGTSNNQNYDWSLVGAMVNYVFRGLRG